MLCVRTVQRNKNGKDSFYTRPCTTQRFKFIPPSGASDAEHDDIGDGYDIYEHDRLNRMTR